MSDKPMSPEALAEWRRTRKHGDEAAHVSRDGSGHVSIYRIDEVKPPLFHYRGDDHTGTAPIAYSHPVTDEIRQQVKKRTMPETLRKLWALMGDSPFKWGVVNDEGPDEALDAWFRSARANLYAYAETLGVQPADMENDEPT